MSLLSLMAVTPPAFAVEAKPDSGVAKMLGNWGYLQDPNSAMNMTDTSGISHSHSIGMELYKNGDRSINAFAGPGFADGTAQSRDRWSLGFVFSGFIPARKNGQLGLVLSQAKNSYDHILAADAPLDSGEKQVEFTYKDMLTPTLSIQPDLQYTIDPGADPALKNAWTAGIKLGMDFDF